jgi:DNA-binding response OmpR family regulator
MIVAMSLEDLITLEGCRVTKAGRLSRALELAGTETLHGALLDVNLRGEKVFPVADVLDRRDIPFIFLTGYGADYLDPPWRERPVLEKPYDPEALLELIITTFAA